MFSHGRGLLSCLLNHAIYEVYKFALRISKSGDRYDGLL